MMNLENLELNILEPEDISIAAQIIKKAYGSKMTIKNIEQKMNSCIDLGDSLYVSGKIDDELRGIYRMNLPALIGLDIFIGPYGHLATNPEQRGIGCKMFEILGDIFENVSYYSGKTVFNMVETNIRSKIFLNLEYKEYIDYEETIWGDFVEKYIYTKDYIGQKKSMSISESKIIDKLVESIKS